VADVEADAPGWPLRAAKGELRDPHVPPARGPENLVDTGLWHALGVCAHLDPLSPAWLSACRLYPRGRGSSVRGARHTRGGFPEEIFLEAEFHRVGLRPWDEHPMLARRQHLVGQDDHAVVPGVHHAHGRDVAERFPRDRLLAPDLGGDVGGRDVRHALGGNPVLGIPTGVGVC
jgi:hypothetical protein